MSLLISNKGVFLNGNRFSNLKRRTLKKNVDLSKIKNDNKDKYKNKKDNNKQYRDFIKIARKWDKYKDMGYHEFLKSSRDDYYEYIENLK